MMLRHMIKIAVRLAKNAGAELLGDSKFAKSEKKIIATPGVDVSQDQTIEACAHLHSTKELKPDNTDTNKFNDTSLSNVLLSHFRTGDIKNARCVARKLDTLQESRFLESRNLIGGMPIIVSALLGREKKHLIAVCKRAGPNHTLGAIRKMRNLNFSGMENLWDAAMLAFPKDAEIATLCTELNILTSRHEGVARAVTYEKWLKLAGNSACLGDTYKLFRISHPNSPSRIPIVALRDAMDRATDDEMVGSKRVEEAVTACNFGDLALAKKILAKVPSKEPGLNLAYERFEDLQETLDWLAEEVQDAIYRFWKIAATASDPLAAARSMLREESDCAAILMPFGQAPFGKKVTVNNVKVPMPKPMHIMGIIKATVKILQARGQAYRIHMWPWPLGDNLPLAGHVRTLSFHAIATEGDTRTILHKRSHIPDTWLISRSGHSGLSALHQLTRDDILRLETALRDREAFFRALHEKYIDANLSTKLKPELNHVGLPDEYVFLATQAPADTVQASYAWINRLDMISESVRWAKKTGKPLVIKRHPVCRDIRITRLLDRELPANVHVVNGPIQDLIKQARAVIVGNSSVGFEALMHGKIVIATAPSDYQLATRTARSVDALHETLDAMDSLSDDSDFVKSFVHVYLKKLVIDPNNEKAVKVALSRQFELAGWWDA